MEPNRPHAVVFAVKRSTFVTTSAAAATAAAFALRAPAFAAADMTLATPTGTLAGTLEVPATPGPAPVVLIIAGSGPTDRDGNTPLLPGKNDTLKQLALGLASRGVASVRYDKRGVGASAAAWCRSRPALRHLRRRRRGVDQRAARAEAVLARRRHRPQRGRADRHAGRCERAGRPLCVAEAPAGGADDHQDQVQQAARRSCRRSWRPRRSACSTQLAAGRTVSEVPPALATLYPARRAALLISWIKYRPRARDRRGAHAGCDRPRHGRRPSHARRRGRAPRRAWSSPVRRHRGDEPRPQTRARPVDRRSVIAGYTNPALQGTEPIVVDTVARIARGQT